MRLVGALVAIGSYALKRRMGFAKRNPSSPQRKDHDVAAFAGPADVV